MYSNVIDNCRCKIPAVQWSSTGKVMGMSASSDGLLLCTISDDKSLKVFDVINFGKQSF